MFAFEQTRSDNKKMECNINASCECTDTCFDIAVVGKMYCVYDSTISLNRLFSQTMCKIELRNYILNNVIYVLHIVPKQQNTAFRQRCTQQLQFAWLSYQIHINRVEAQIESESRECERQRKSE